MTPDPPLHHEPRSPPSGADPGSNVLLRGMMLLATTLAGALWMHMQGPIPLVVWTTRLTETVPWGGLELLLVIAALGTVAGFKLLLWDDPGTLLIGGALGGAVAMVSRAPTLLSGGPREKDAKRHPSVASWTWRL